MTNTNATEGNKSIRFCLRSFIAFVLAPQAPIIEWLKQLDGWTQNSPGFFASKPVVLDLTTLQLGQAEIRLLDQLAERNIRIIGLEGADGSQLNPSLPPLLISGRAVEHSGASDAAATNATDKPSAAPLAPDEPTSLLIETSIRSGQTVFFPGDVTVLGSVASGSEIVAGGSIHVYGTLRGRAMAGSQGNARARIFCRRKEAEVLAINGYYRTAAEVDADIRSQPVQSWLEDGMLVVAPLE